MSSFFAAFKCLVNFLSPPPRGTGLRNLYAGCHLPGVYRAPRAELEARLEFHEITVRGLFVVLAVAARTEVLALVPWGVRGLNDQFSNILQPELLCEVNLLTQAPRGWN